MALIVEDGSGLGNAESLVSVAEADAFFAAFDATKWNGNTTDKEQALRRVSAYMSYSINWAGFKLKNRLQSLAFPRTGLIDSEGYSIGQNEIPIEVKTACYHLAALEHDTPNILNPSVVMADRTKREKVGDIEVEYLNNGLSINSYIPTMSLVNELIAPFTQNKAGQSFICGTAVRA